MSATQTTTNGSDSAILAAMAEAEKEILSRLEDVESIIIDREIGRQWSRLRAKTEIEWSVYVQVEGEPAALGAHADLRIAMEIALAKLAGCAKVA